MVVTSVLVDRVSKSRLHAAPDTLDRLFASPVDCKFFRSEKRCTWTLSVSTERKGTFVNFSFICITRDRLYLLVVRFRAQVDQVGRDTGQETLAISTARAMVCLHKIFVQLVNGRLEGLSVDLEGDKRGV